MTSSLWQLAISGLLCLGFSAQSLADERRAGSPLDELRDGGAQHNQQNQRRQAELQQDRQIQQQQNQMRNAERQQQQQIYQQQQQQQRQLQEQYNQQRQAERQQDQQIQQQQNQMRNVERQQQQQLYQQQREQQRQIQEQQNQQRQQLRQQQNNLPIQGRPDQVWQTQPPRQGYYRDLPRDQRPRDNWAGRPDGRGDGWGAGPRYRPGQHFDRAPQGYARIPWRGQDYFYSGGYWYRPQDSRYVVVTPPYGVRVRSLPDYTREVWIGGSLLFMAAGTYYAWQADSQDYEVVSPPQGYAQPVPGNNSYDPQFSPIAGQTAEQVEFDRYQCYRQAVDQSGFDPANVTYQPSEQVVDTYRRAMGACLYERGYSVQ
ncbi:hypothetical protein NJC40_20720 [Pseudomonas sp. 21LCFQ02]|uniref:DUF6515 family protein n=1 Tax=unclassified Pseudomonas TaxID=196821 RepID=UPI000A99E3B5|nr:MULTISPECIES: DUF6515 family protein [unclassified Pseudomonas]MCO8170190.1 hypothetical protein [Pseudomonas sp. 21LCFQ02]MCQ9424619.1 hypothetical protein [Pseudomonas sp. LJDD11]